MGAWWAGLAGWQKGLIAAVAALVIGGAAAGIAIAVTSGDDEQAATSATTDTSATTTEPDTTTETEPDTTTETEPETTTETEPETTTETEPETTTETEPETTTVTETETEPTTETEPDAELAEVPDSPVSASIDQAYKVPPDGGQAEEPDSGELPVPPGTVDAKWYRSGDIYVLVYAALSLEDTGPLCPGNSLGTDSGFEFVTNSPTADGACEGAPNVIEGDDVGAQTCDTLVYYITEIPLDQDGILFGTIERYAEDGTIVGLTSQVPADAEAAPEFTLDADGYSVPAGFLPDPQQTEVIC